MIPDKRKKILELFINNPFGSFHLREAARLSGVSLCNVNDTFKYLFSEGAFRKKTDGNKVYYLPELKNHRLLKMFEILEMEKRELFLLKNLKRAVWENITDELLFAHKVNLQLLMLTGKYSADGGALLVVHNGDDDEAAAEVNRIAKNIEHLERIAFSLIRLENYINEYSKTTRIMDIIQKKQVILYNEHLFWRLAGLAPCCTAKETLRPKSHLREDQPVNA